MGIYDKTIKTLWGRAAGRCSFPECRLELYDENTLDDFSVLGEMAHNFGKQENSARHDPLRGVDDSYDNLILLCPTHHTMVDKSPKKYTTTTIRKWKRAWEDEVAAKFLPISDRATMFAELFRLAETNRQVHSEWGPTSLRAQKHPTSSEASGYWRMKRIVTIIPNNAAICNILRGHKELLSTEEWGLAIAFMEHAGFYEKHCLNPADASAYLPFPPDFYDLIVMECSNVKPI